KAFPLAIAVSAKLVYRRLYFAIVIGSAWNLTLRLRFAGLLGGAEVFAWPIIISDARLTAPSVTATEQPQTAAPLFRVHREPGFTIGSAAEVAGNVMSPDGPGAPGCVCYSKAYAVGDTDEAAEVWHVTAFPYPCTVEIDRLQLTAESVTITGVSGTAFIEPFIGCHSQNSPL
ncbi:MAG: hypothetical protein AAB368_01740, partial [bacterium]